MREHVSRGHIEQIRRRLVASDVRDLVIDRGDRVRTVARGDDAEIGQHPRIDDAKPIIGGHVRNDRQGILEADLADGNRDAPLVVETAVRRKCNPDRFARASRASASAITP